MLNQIRRKLNRRGSSLIEAAFVFNVLLLLSFCTVEFGYFLYAKHTIQGAAREGARAAVVPGATTGEVTAAIARTLFAAGMNDGSVTVNSSKFSHGIFVNNSVATPDQPPGTAVEVRVLSTMGQIGPKPLFFMGADKQIKGATIMRKEG